MDVANLLDLPLRVSAPSCRPFGEVIDELQRLRPDPAHPLKTPARRQELAFRTPELLCNIAPLREDAAELVRQRDRLGPALSLMKDHMADPLTVADLAHCANLSIPQFHVLFRRLIGRPPMDHLKHLRLSEACRLLAVADTPLRVIAEQTGFCSEFHLSRVFRTAFGQPPGLWRRSYDHNLM